ncbi:MAG: OmpL47-type beta-barrel domain-containing protein, partial [Thermoplasmata archaeon]
GGSWQIYSGPITITQNGNHTIEYYSTDNAGNMETPKSITVKIDKTPPLTDIMPSGIAGDNNWYVSDVAITMSAHDDTSGAAYVTYRIDGGPWQIYSGPITITQDGNHTIEYYSTDNAGNDEPMNSMIVKKDSAPAQSNPPIVSDSEGSYGWFKSGVTVTLSAHDHTAGVKYKSYRTDGGPWQIYSGPITITQDGNHTIEYNSTDNAGNMETTKSLAIKIDKTRPSTSPPTVVGTEGDNNWYVSDVTITVSAIDEVSGVDYVTYRIDSGPWQVYSDPITITDDGEHTIEYYSVDIAGNDEVPVSYVVKMDTLSPTVVSTYPAANSRHVKTTITIIIQFSESMNQTTVEQEIHFSPRIEIEDFKWANDNMTLYIYFTSDLSHGVKYEVSIDYKAKDVPGNSMGTAHTWSFETESAAVSDFSWVWLPVGLILLALLVIILLLFARKKMPKEELEPTQYLEEEELIAEEGFVVEYYESPEDLKNRLRKLRRSELVEIARAMGISEKGKKQEIVNRILDAT